MSGPWYPGLMKDEEYRAKYGRLPPTQAERRIAARIVVVGNRALRKKTPEWIRKLAAEKD